MFYKTMTMLFLDLIFIDLSKKCTKLRTTVRRHAKHQGFEMLYDCYQELYTFGI